MHKSLMPFRNVRIVSLWYSREFDDRGVYSILLSSLHFIACFDSTVRMLSTFGSRRVIVLVRMRVLTTLAVCMNVFPINLTTCDVSDICDIHLSRIVSTGFNTFTSNFNLNHIHFDLMWLLRVSVIQSPLCFVVARATHAFQNVSRFNSESLSLPLLSKVTSAKHTYTSSWA